MTPVILSGGAGVRLWPCSRELYPKQLLKLTSGYSLLQQTFLRLQMLEGEVGAPVVVCHQEHRFAIAEQLREIGINNAKLILEPVANNTAPATAVAALFALEQDPDATLLVLPADHLIDDVTLFCQATVDAVSIADKGFLVTFGVTPSRPETGYGYIQRGKAIGAVGYQVEQFIEKPGDKQAQCYVSRDDFYWNSGMFVFQAKSYLEEMYQCVPEVAECCRRALVNAEVDLDFIRLDKQTYSCCQQVSVDYAIMEKTSKAVMVMLDANWHDLGSWESLWEVSSQDAERNVTMGDVLLHDVKNSYIRAEDRLVAAVGVSDIVIVDTADALLVVNKAHAQQVKEIVKQLRMGNRSEHCAHNVVYRPWGRYQFVDAGEYFKVKRITIKVGARLSLQLHHHRAEHWVVVQGKAKVTCGDREFVLQKNESTDIPAGTKHRLENIGRELLEVIEVQSGAHLSEEDIVRLEDDYSRLSEASTCGRLEPLDLG